MSSPKDDLTPNYNISPGSDAAVVTGADGGNQLGFFRWGLIPSWAKDSKVGYKMINARMETLTERPTWRRSLIIQRAVIPASGFYEWKREGKGKIKRPFAIRPKEGGLIGFAGLYDIWKDEVGKEVRSFSIITRPANDIVDQIHDRMPVILTREGRDVWLDNSVKDLEFLKQILRSDTDDDIKAYPVSDRVNKADNNDPELIEEV